MLEYYKTNCEKHRKQPISMALVHLDDLFQLKFCKLNLNRGTRIFTIYIWMKKDEMGLKLKILTHRHLIAHMQDYLN